MGTKSLHVFKHGQLSLNRYPFRKIKYTETTFGSRVPECQKAGKHSKRIRHAHPLLTFSKQLLRTALGNKALATWADQYSSPYRPKLGNRLSKPRTKTSTDCLSSCRKRTGVAPVSSTLQILPVATSLECQLIFM